MRNIRTSALIWFALVAAYCLGAFVHQQPVHAQLAAASGFQYTKITTNVCTTVKATTAQLHAILVSGAGSSWTIQVFDNASACSGTAIFGATAVTVPTAGTSIPFEIQANNGISILTAGTTPGELTVSWR